MRPAPAEPPAPGDEPAALPHPLLCQRQQARDLLRAPLAQPALHHPESGLRRLDGIGERMHPIARTEPVAGPPEVTQFLPQYAQARAIVDLRYGDHHPHLSSARCLYTFNSVALDVRRYSRILNVPHAPFPASPAGPWGPN